MGRPGKGAVASPCLSPCCMKVVHGQLGMYMRGLCKDQHTAHNVCGRYVPRWNHTSMESLECRVGGHISSCGNKARHARDYFWGSVMTCLGVE
jgi:hypothetical protein